MARDLHRAWVASQRYGHGDFQPPDQGKKMFRSTSHRRGAPLRASAPKLLAGLGGLLLAAHALASPVVVMPGNLQGWFLGDGSNGTSPATITAAQAFQGNGSVQLSLNAGNQPPLAAARRLRFLQAGDRRQRF